MRELQVTRRFQRDCLLVPASIVSAIDQIATDLRRDPRGQIHRAKKLVNVTPSQYRVRIGDYRLIYSYNETAVHLRTLQNRRDVYRNL